MILGPEGLCHVVCPVPAVVSFSLSLCISQESSPPQNPESQKFLRAYSRCGSGVQPRRSLSPSPAKTRAVTDTEAAGAPHTDAKVRDCAPLAPCSWCSRIAPASCSAQVPSLQPQKAPCCAGGSLLSGLSCCPLSFQIQVEGTSVDFVSHNARTAKRAPMRRSRSLQSLAEVLEQKRREQEEYNAKQKGHVPQ